MDKIKPCNVFGIQLKTTYDCSWIGLSAGRVWPQDLWADKTAEEILNNED